MKNISKIILWIIFVIVIYLFYNHVYDGTESTLSTLDNKFYKVRSIKGKEQKANLLALINLKLDTIVSTLATSQYNNDQNVQRLIKNWKKGVTIKEIGKMETDAAYVINKQYMSFCLPEDISDSLDNINLMTYVGIHELAHIMSNEIGHGKEFIRNFEFLLNYSKETYYTEPSSNKKLPIYIQLDKLNTADNYCGVPLINSIN